jgi:hypothetical protein
MITQKKSEVKGNNKQMNARVMSNKVLKLLLPLSMQRSRGSGFASIVLRRWPGYLNPCATWGSKGDGVGNR